MTVSFTNAIAAYANAGKMPTAPGLSEAGGAGSSFGDLVKGAIEGTVHTLQKGEQATMEAATGKTDLIKVTQAVNDAEVALQSVTAVRDKMVQAYQSIIQMPI
jgi:flagellar hook-basal body complex protein FliE